MKTFFSVLSMLAFSSAIAQTPLPFVVDANTVALWHLDETSGTFVRDSSLFGNNGTAIGTTIGIGRFGNAKSFNGLSDYLYVSDPTNGSLDFENNHSFTIDVWFKTTTQTGVLIRKGLAPTAGYNLLISSGHVQGEVGNREDSHYPDTLVRIRSEQVYNDGQWHVTTLERDRSARTISLYVDGALVAPPVNDPITFPLSSDRPLTMGKWENNVQPTYYAGFIDEVRISNIARHAPIIASDSAAIWAFDESSGFLVRDDSPYHNDGTAFGTTIITGHAGNARQFNGFNDYIGVGDPSNGSLDFLNGQSFTIEAWFKTTSLNNQQILRKGLAPVQGYELKTNAGRVEVRVGNREDSHWPDTLLTIRSTNLYNDGVWHKATMVRDQTQRRLFLYVDGILAAPSIADPVQFSLANDRPFTIGRWENSTLPTYFNGAIDDIRIYRSAHHGISLPAIQVLPEVINFGIVPVGRVDTLMVQIANLSFSDTLRVLNISSNNIVFTSTIETISVPPGSSRNILVQYIPTAAVVDTGSLSISSNDPNRPVVRLRLNGQGFLTSAAPLVSSIRDIPADQGKQIRVIWYRSEYDGINDSLHITDYNVWRRVGNSALWDFIATIPAVRFEQYAFVAPTLFDSSRTVGIRWSVFRVSAHTANGAQVFFSPPDSGYSVDNLAPLGPTNLDASFEGGHVNLAWVAPPDPDVQFFGVYRSTAPNFLPSPANQIGTSSTPNYSDQGMGGNPSYYYCVTAFDTTGNQSGPSNQAYVVITDVTDLGTLPGQFQLYQNYPNPFNPTSRIRYDVASESRVTLKLFDMLGREVLTLVDETKSPGLYEADFNAQSLSSGVYFYRMQASNYSSLKKMILMK